MRIDRVTEAAQVHRAADLFDRPPRSAATAVFLAAPGHHLLVAYDDHDDPVGMVTGVELTHPDKGTEMFVYELGVAPSARRRGVATALLHALGALARSRGCYGMWVAVDTDNDAALATYARAGARDEGDCTVRGWTWNPDDRVPSAPA
ncbi:GNAT family N-acetyltransferase [Nakamurella deserti]|uniref:GNAT family N-acetyltransferase n=1 Tax=Nakamurella deserti TaxID=2164074 RepID=UPI000DBE6D5C|nr:GNAT family N-acetyltransferase [Nakamurella deserti]